MEKKSNFNKMKIIQDSILNFLEGENDEKSLTSLINIIDQNIEKTQYEIKDLLYLISKISDNHNRKNDFIKKIEQLLRYFKEEIKQNFTNSSIFNIFKKNKRILLFLFEEQYITIDKYIFSVITNNKYEKMNYYQYFLPEIISYLSKKPIEASKSASNLFNQKRKRGENDNCICTLIQNDSLSEFISYVNKMNISLSSEINQSIFETNIFLLNQKKCNLIEYAAFFGSIQIFKYFVLGKIKLTESIWDFAIHGNNAEMINFLEEQQIKQSKNLFYESIKCFHIDLASYFVDKYSIEISKFINLFIKYRVYSYLAELEYDKKQFKEYVTYDYISIVKELFKDNDLNEIINDNGKNETDYEENGIEYHVWKQKSYSLFNRAVEKGNSEMVKLFLEESDIDLSVDSSVDYTRSGYGANYQRIEYIKSALIIAVENEFVDIVRNIIECPFPEIDFEMSINERKTTGSCSSHHSTEKVISKTPLIIAIEKRNVEIVSLLLSAEADVNISLYLVQSGAMGKDDKREIYPLDLSIENGSSEIVELLLKNEYFLANANQINVNRVFKLALEKGNEKIIELLSNYLFKFLEDKISTT